MIELLDVVALTVDLPEYNLWRGQVGTVVELLANGTAYEKDAPMNPSVCIQISSCSSTLSL